MPSTRYWRFKIINKEEKIRRWKIIFFWFSFTAAFLTIIWSFFFSPFFEITEIKLPENDIVTNNNIKQLVDMNMPFKLGENLLALPKNQLKQALAAAFPEITNIVVDKELFHTLRVDFTKRIQIGIWCQPKADQPQADNCYYFDKEGIIFAEAPISEGTLILKVTDNSKKIVSLGDKVIDDEKLNFIKSFTAEMNKSDELRITEFKIKPVPNIDLEAVTDGGWLIYLDKDQDASLAANNLITTLNEAVKDNVSNLEYIDLRIPSRIFYKLK